MPGPLPLGVAVIDQSITLFGLVFPRVANKHRLQMLNHFAECIKQVSPGRVPRAPQAAGSGRDCGTAAPQH